MNIRRGATLAASVILVVACGSATPSGSPAAISGGPSGAPASAAATAAATAQPTSHVLGLDWGKADVVEAPPGDATATTPPYDDSGSLGHPQAYQGGQADLFDVTSTSVGLVAVGYLARDITASAWLSTDARTWRRIVDFPAAEGSQAVAVIDGPAGIVAVGGEGDHAITWRSTDGKRWERAPDAASWHDTTQLRMTAVASSPDGYVAAGYLGGLAGPIEARFWWSEDGLTWFPAGDGTDVMASRVAAVVAGSDGGFVAVGASGDARSAVGSAAWTSPDGRTWTRLVPGDALAAGVMRGVTAAGGHGFVAVGSDADSVRAVTWRSPDGSAWEVAPDSASLDNFELKIEMRDVAWDGTRFVAAGHRLFGQQFPTGVLWVSEDGWSWVRAVESAALSQGKVFAVTPGGPGFVAVGSFGSPDFAIPTVWLSPP